MTTGTCLAARTPRGSDRTYRVIFPWEKVAFSSESVLTPAINWTEGPKAPVESLAHGIYLHVTPLVSIICSTVSRFGDVPGQSQTYRLVVDHLVPQGSQIFTLTVAALTCGDGVIDHAPVRSVMTATPNLEMGVHGM